MKNLKRSILPAYIISIAGLLLSLILFTNIAQARQPDIVKDLTNNPIPSDRVDPFFLYFAYGNPNSDTDILNARATLDLTGEGFELVPDNFSDLYFGSPDRPDSENPPDVAACNSSYTGPVYMLSGSLGSTTSLSYGFQTSTDSSGAGGSTQSSTLRAKHTGCLKIQVKVKAGAIAEQQATITFDPDADTSPSYQEANRPGKQVVILKTGAGSGTVTDTTISADNLSAGACTTVDLGAETTCEFPLKNGTNFVLPSQGITVTVPDSTVSPNCTLPDNTKIVCANVPTTGSSAGAKEVPTSLGNSPTAQLQINALDTTPDPTIISAINLVMGTCDPVDVGAVTTCNYPLTGDSNNSYSLPTTGLTVTVPDSTVSPNCTINDNNTSSAKLSCANVPTTGSSAGAKEVPTSLGSSPTASLLINNTSTTSGSTSGNDSSSSSTSSDTSTTSSTTSSSTSNTNANSSSSASSSSSSSSSNTSSNNTLTNTTKSYVISGNAGDTKTIENPVGGISKFEITLQDQISNGNISYNLLDSNGTCTSNVTGVRRLATSFDFGANKSKIKDVKITFSLSDNVTNVKAYSCDSPGVETNVTSLGSSKYTATIPPASTFVVTADTVNSPTTARSGGVATFFILVVSSLISGSIYLLYKSRKNIGKVNVVK